MGRLPSGFLLNLNAFFAVLMLLASFGMFIFYLPARMLANFMFSGREAELAGWWVAYALMVIAVGWWWNRFGLSPAHRRPDRERSFRIGHSVLLVCNAGGALMWLSFLAPATWRAQPAMALLLAPAAVAPLGAVVGLSMVHGSRGAPAPAFADTVLQTRGAIGAASRQPQPAGRALTGAGVVFGLLVTGVVAYMATIFAGLGFQSNPGRWAHAVVPAAIAAYVIYAAIALWLHGSGNGAAALKFAWAPIFLAVVVLPGLQILALFVQTLFGRH